jgi:hypothetical protein
MLDYVAAADARVVSVFDVTAVYVTDLQVWPCLRL